MYYLGGASAGKPTYAWSLVRSSRTLFSSRSAASLSSNSTSKTSFVFSAGGFGKFGGLYGYSLNR